MKIHARDLNGSTWSAPGDRTSYRNTIAVIQFAIVAYMVTQSTLHKDLPVYAFVNAKEFEAWLNKNYQQPTGFWMRLYKKATNLPTIQMTDAVDIALCYGWIDGLINAYDNQSYLIRFTPRRPKSVWSKINVAKVEKLIAEGRMQPAGLVHIEAAKADGRWDKAY